MIVLVIASAASHAAAQSISLGPRGCAALRELQLPGFALSELSAEWIPAGPAPAPLPAVALPAYCRVQATLDRRQGVDGQQYGIGFALALDTIDYYNRLAATNGGADAVPRWSRLFLVPGMGHCRGGSLTTDSFDLLKPLVDWVERGVAPDAVVAARSSETRLTRPLCAYPRYAHYSGRGDPNNASSFACRAP